MKRLPQPSVLWLDGLRRPRHPKLVGRAETDVVVIGAGIVGLTVAELLRRDGVRVVVLEADRVSNGTTGGSSAHVTHVLDLDHAALIERHGEDRAAAFVGAAREGVEWIARFAEGEPRCAFERVSGWRFAERRDQVDALERDLHAARRLGVEAEADGEPPLPFRTARAIRYPDQARFDPARYVLALARAFTAGGGTIHENTRVRRVHHDDRGCRLEADSCELRARVAVMATHTPIGFDLVQTEVLPTMSYLMAWRVQRPLAPGLFWDLETPYHYLRGASDAEGALLLAGGEDHRTGREEDTRRRYESLSQWVRERFTLGPLVHRWAAQFFEPADGMPYVGRSPSSPCVFEATGFAGVGLSVGTAAAIQIAAQIQGRSCAWEDVFDSRRVRPVESGVELVKKNVADVTTFVKDRLDGGDAARLADVPHGEGRLIALDGEKLAVYREASGKCHAFSPACRHLGCHVRWNTAEQTWDCPCHGGRYQATGQVIEGPPTEALEPRVIRGEGARPSRLNGGRSARSRAAGSRRGAPHGSPHR